MKNNPEGAGQRPATRREPGAFVRKHIESRVDRRTATIIGSIVIAGVLLTGAILLTGRRSSGGDAAAEGGALDYPRGPNGARLLSDGPLQLEMTIYETGVPPHFRIYPFDAGLKPVAPKDVALEVELHRLGGRVDRIRFRPEADYLRGMEVVEEPHSFDVKVMAQHGGRRHQWTYSQIEGKVKLGADQVRSAGIVINTVGARRMVTSLELPGEVKTDETRLAHVVPRLSGVVTAVYKKEGDRVRRGELMAILNSRELATAKSAYIGAAQQVEFTRAALLREESLWKQKISPQQDYLEAKRVFDGARLAERLADQNLVVLGVSSGALRGLVRASAGDLSRHEVRAPLDGEVIERKVTIGEAVTAEGEIFTVADLSTVWVDVTVNTKDIGAVRAGQEVTVQSTDLGSEVSGRISYIGPLVGQETRAATARIVLANPGGRWRPGLFVTVRLVREATMVLQAVSADAIQTFRDWQVVFVKYGDWFEARPVELGRSDGEWVEVVKGLAPGEQYAGANSFAVKAEIGKLGATHDH